MKWHLGYRDDKNINVLVVASSLVSTMVVA